MNKIDNNRTELIRLSLSFGLYWGWMSLFFFSDALFPTRTNPIPYIELVNFISLASCTIATIVVAILSANVADKIESDRKALTAVLIGGALGTGIVVFFQESMVFLVSGAILVGIVEGILLYLLCSRVVKVASSSEDIIMVFSSALVIASILYLLTLFFGGFTGAVLCILMPLFSLGPLSYEARKSTSEMTSTEQVAHAFQPLSAWRNIKRFPWKLIIGLSIFGIAFGFMRISASTQSLDVFQMSYVAHTLSRAATALIAFFLIVKLKRAYWTLSTVQLLGFTLGLCAYWVPWEHNAVLVVASTTVGFTCLELLLWVILFEFYSEMKSSFNSLYGIMRGMINLTMLLATAGIFFWGSHLTGTVVQLLLIALLLVMVLVSSLLFGSRNIASLWGIEKETIDASDKQNERISAYLASEYNLTSRETEVVSLLMKGRNEPFISEALFISPHTTHSHISHIYTKMKIHSRQELLDIIENHLDVV